MLQPIKEKSIYYLGKKNLRNEGAEIEMTPEQQIEYLRCSSDPLYFIQNYVYIVTLDKGKQLFALRDYQKEMMQTVFNNRFVLSLLPRQSGKTQTVAAIILWYVLFNEDFKVCLLAHKKNQAREIIDRVQLSYEMLPLWMQQGVKIWNRGNIELENGSKVDTEATTDGSIRGRTYNIVYLDEFAHVEPAVQEAFFTSTYPTITSGTDTKIVITTTPKGLEYFYKLWTDSENGKNDYVRFRAEWWEIPGRDEAWKQETIRNTSERQFLQEFELEFHGSSSTLIDGRKLRATPTIDPINQEDFINSIGKDVVAVFEKPLKDHKYVITVDTSEAKEKDYSAFVVFDVTEAPYRVVARFRSNTIPTMVYPVKIEEIAKLYNNAWVLIEVNSVGFSVAYALNNDIGYENVFHSKVNGAAGQVLGHHGSLGVKTTKSVKAIGCQYLKTIVETDQMVINDSGILAELSTFTMKPNGTFSAEQGKNDDLVICLVLFAWLVKQDFFKIQFEHDITEDILEAESEMWEQDTQPLNVIIGEGSGQSVNDFFYNGEYEYSDPLFGKW